MTSGHISLFGVLGCRRFWNRVENSRSKMSEPSGPCSDVEGTVKVDILKFPKGIGKPPNRPSGRRRFCAVQAFWPKAKTLAQAEFTSAEQLKSTGWRPPPAAGTQKRRTSDRMSFFFGTPGATRTHYIPLRSTGQIFYSVVIRSKLFQYLQCLNSVPFHSAETCDTPFD